MEIKDYRIEIKGSLIYFESFLHKFLPFLNESQISEFIHICSKTKGDITELTNYLNSLEIGFFKFIELSRDGFKINYILIRVIN